jgi:hypothetical protein
VGKTLKGIYPTLPDALAAIDTLKELGHLHDDITVVASEHLNDGFPYCIDAGAVLNSDGMFDELVDSPSLWNKVKDALSPDPEYTLDDYIADSLKDILYPYKKEICAGNIVVLVDTESQEKL